MRRNLIALGLLSAFLAPASARAQEGPERLDDTAAPDYIDENGMPVYADDGSPGPERLTVAPPRTPPGRYRYCTPHPIPNEVGGGWDATQGAHERDYPPLDPYLFIERDGCFYFVGDPRDFGYQGETYAYYGSHPVAYDHGGGFCFHVGTHFHLWGPFGPYFMLSDGWWGWAGPLPAWYWWYYPYYHRYWTGYYPRYYGGGRYHHPPPRAGGGIVARPSTPPRPPLPPPGTTPDAHGGRTLTIQGFDRKGMVPTHMPATIPGTSAIRNLPITPARPMGPGAGRARGPQRYPQGQAAPYGGPQQHEQPPQRAYPYNYAPQRAYPAPQRAYPYAPPQHSYPTPQRAYPYAPPQRAYPVPAPHAPPVPRSAPAVPHSAPAPHPAPHAVPHGGGSGRRH